MSTQNEEQLKKQRERFLSFSFAASDLLLEIDDLGKITYALGSIKKFTGKESSSDLLGQHWLEIFIPKDRMTLEHMVTKAAPGHRCGPSLTSLQHLIGSNKEESEKKSNVVISAIKMPDKPQTYIGIATSNTLIDQLGNTCVISGDKIHDKESFIDSAQQTLRIAKDIGQDVDLSMIHLPGAEKAQNRFGKEAWSNLSEGINNLLRDYSIDGNSAATLGAGHFTLLHTSDVDIEELVEKFSGISKEHDPFNEGLDVDIKNITADTRDMDERDIARALFYTLNEFERRGTNVADELDTLSSSLKVFVTANVSKIREFKNIVQNLDFQMHFQPIVELRTRECNHYEMLCRFREGNTYEWIVFGEGIGMAAEFDFAVCRQALNYIDTKRWNTNESYSINVSGQSIADKAFLIKLNKAIDLHKNIKHRIILEITESTQIRDLDFVGRVIKSFQNKGIRIALDDFGAGAASFQYLSNMHVDYVKIDGKFIKNILNETRDMVLVKNIAQMCKDLDVKVVGEFVENKEIAALLLELGIDYGQGYFFGKPSPAPDYKKPSRR